MASLSSGDKTIITSFPQGVKRYLSICPRTVLFSGQLSADPTLDTVSGGIISFPVDNTSGTSGDCIKGMTIDFGTSAGAKDVGQARLRSSISGSTIEIEEKAFADLPIRDNTYFSVREEFVPKVKMLYLEADTEGNSRFPNSFIEYHDYDEAYTNQNVAIKPCVNITRSATEEFPPKYAGFLDTGEVYRTVDLSCALSEFPAGDTFDTILWDVGDCTINVGTATSQTIEIQAPEGFRYVSCTILGTSGGQQVQRIPIHAHGDTYTPLSTALRGFEVTADDTESPGRKMTIRIFGQPNSVLPSDVVEGSPFNYWEIVNFDGQDAPSQYRDQFYGWSINRKPSTNRNDPVEIDIHGIGIWANSILTGFGIQIEDVGRVPSKHYYMQNMSIDKVAHYILREFTTIPNLANIFLSGITTDTTLEKINKATIFSQIDQFIKSFKCDLKCDTGGAFWFRENINYMDEGEEYDTGLFFSDERASVPNITIIDDSMIAENGITIQFPAVKPLGRVDAVGAYSNGVKEEPGVVASRAPGKVQGQSSASESTPFMRLDGDEDDAIIELNYVSGRYFANRIDPYQNIDIELLGNLDVFEGAWGETVILDISPSNVGGLSIDPSWLFTINSIKINHSNQIGQPRKRVTLNVSRVTNGEPGVNIPIEDIDWLENPFYDLYYAASSVIPPPQTEAPSLDSYNDQIVDFAVVGEGDSDKVLRTFSFNNNSPSWEDITPSSVPGTRTLAMVDGRLDGSNVPLRALYFQSTTYEIYATANALAESPVWALEESGTITGTNPNDPILVADKESELWVVAWASDDGVRVTRKTSGSWSAVEVVGSSSFTNDVSGQYLGLGVRNGKIVICGAVAAGTYQLYQATDLGAFSTISGGNASNPFNSIKIDDSDSVYVSSFADDHTITEDTTSWAFLSSKNLINETPNPAIVDGNNWYFDDTGVVDGAQLTAEWYFDGTLAKESSWTPFLRGRFESGTYLGATYSVPTGDFYVDVTVTVYTNNIGEYVFTPDLVYDDGTAQATYLTALPGPIYVYYVTGPQTLYDVLQDLPDDAEINYIKMDMVVNGTPPPTNGVYSMEWYLYQEAPDFTYDDVNVNNSEFYRIDDYASSPSWVDITPTDGYIPENFNSITIDALNENLMHYHGTLDNASRLWVFTSKRGERRIITSGKEFYASKRAGPVYLAYGNNKLHFSTDRIAGLESKFGDMEAVAGITTPEILNAMVLFGV